MARNAREALQNRRPERSVEGGDRRRRPAARPARSSPGARPLRAERTLSSRAPLSMLSSVAARPGECIIAAAAALTVVVATVVATVSWPVFLSWALALRIFEHAQDEVWAGLIGGLVPSGSACVLA